MHPTQFLSNRLIRPHVLRSPSSSVLCPFPTIVQHSNSPANGSADPDLGRHRRPSYGSRRIRRCLRSRLTPLRCACAALCVVFFRSVILYLGGCMFAPPRPTLKLRNLDLSATTKLTKRQIDKVWNEYDRDGNGFLEYEEARKLVGDLLNAVAREESLISSNVTAAALPAAHRRRPTALYCADRRAVLCCGGHCISTGAMEEMFRDPEVKKAKHVKSDLHARLQQDLHKDTEHLTKELLGRMDRNRDMKVDKKEFVGMFQARPSCDVTHLHTAYLHTTRPLWSEREAVC
jgi:hypothetical protein